MKHACPLRWAGGFIAPVLALALAAVPACRVTDLPLWGPAGPSPADALAVEQVRNLAYYEGPGADSVRHRLDLYYPKDVKNYPVVVLVHGGAWIMGDNRCCGLYSAVGEFLASRGIGAVLPNYRLSPAVKHPAHVQDVARALAWTRANIAAYGGRPDQIFLAGHSAGGHLVALLATDESYLKAEGLRTTDIKGVIALSGVYRIPAGSLDVALGGATPLAFRLDELAPLRGESSRGWSKLFRSGLPLRLNVFAPAFGNDRQVREHASPVNHVRRGLPPFLILSAENDLPTLPAMADEFHQALVDQGCSAHLLTIENRNHNSILFRAITTDDPVAGAMVNFIGRNTAGAKD